MVHCSAETDAPNSCFRVGSATVRMVLSIETSSRLVQQMASTP